MPIPISVVIGWFVISILLFRIAHYQVSQISVAFRNILLIACTTIYTYLAYTYVSNHCYSTSLYNSNCDAVPQHAILGLGLPILLVALASVFLSVTGISNDNIDTNSNAQSSGNSSLSHSVTIDPEIGVTLFKDVSPPEYDPPPTYDSVVQSELHGEHKGYSHSYTSPIILPL